MKITIVGGGNVGTQFAVHCSAKGHCVTMYCSKPERFQKDIEIVDEDGQSVLQGTLDKVTNDEKTAFHEAELIFITLPAFCMQEIAERIEPYVEKGTVICLVPGTGGGECCFQGCIAKGCVLTGLQRVPSVARLVQYGRKVRATGYREELKLGALPASAGERCAAMISEIFDMPCKGLANYLNVTLTPSNPILHTSRLYSLFRDYTPDRIYPSVPLFYQEWSMESSEELLACDDELQMMCREMKEFDLSEVRSLREHYESPDAEMLTRKIQSIKGFQGLPTPTVRVAGGFQPDLQSRYFTADFPYGLAILVNIAELICVDVPHMRKILNWYYDISGDKNRFCYADYGIDSYEKLVQFYACRRAE